jgi:hypothetical protein
MKRSSVRRNYRTSIAGIPKDVEVNDIPTDDIELDEDNPRIGYYRDNLSRMSDHVSQEGVAYGIKMGYLVEYNRLKDSIEQNGGTLVEIWVARKEDKYLCIDGNTRVMIYRELQSKYPNKPEWQKIKAKILPKNIDDRTKDFLRLMAHLRGVNDWQVYERARLLYLLWYNKGYTEEELRNTTKLSLNDIRRWREAYRTMNEQFLPKYSHRSDALTKFSYFVEYQNPKILNGMKRYGMNAQDFCDWVGNGEIPRGQDVRLLKTIFESKSAAEALRTRGFEAAKDELMHVEPALGSKLFEHVEECIQGFREMTREEEHEILSEKDPIKLRMINELRKELDGFLGSGD